MEYVWEWFLALHGQRQAGMSTNPISWSDMQAYFTMHALRPSPWELAAIVRLDNAFLESRNSNTTAVAGTAKTLNRMAGKDKKP